MACDFIDSSGLAILVFASRALAALNRQLLLYGAHGQVRRMLAFVAATENGLRVAAGDGAIPAVGESPFDHGFRVTLANGESARLLGSGVTAP